VKNHLYINLLLFIFNINFIGVFAYRKAQMKRNVHDYDSQLTGGFKILNNEGKLYLFFYHNCFNIYLNIFIRSYFKKE